MVVLLTITMISDDHRPQWWSHGNFGAQLKANPAEIRGMRTRIFTSLPSNLGNIKISSMHLSWVLAIIQPWRNLSTLNTLTYIYICTCTPICRHQRADWYTCISNIRLYDHKQYLNYNISIILHTCVYIYIYISVCVHAQIQTSGCIRI